VHPLPTHQRLPLQLLIYTLLSLALWMIAIQFQIMLELTQLLNL
jgi:hypothetical protein